MHQQDMPGAKPSIEPEIIPPGADWQRVSRSRASAGQQHTTRIWITPLGPVGFVFFVLLIVILAFAGVALLFGAALVGIAATGVLLVGGIVSSVLHGQFRRKMIRNRVKPSGHLPVGLAEAKLRARFTILVRRTPTRIRPDRMT